MFNIRRIQRSNGYTVQALWIIVAVLALWGLQPPAARAQSCTFPMTASNQTELDAAITCNNAVTTPGEYMITLGGNILLGASTPAINNPTAGVSLRIDGAGFTVDGQSLNDVRPFTIAANTTVTIENITITGGDGAERGLWRW